MPGDPTGREVPRGAVLVTMALLVAAIGVVARPHAEPVVEPVVSGGEGYLDLDSDPWADVRSGSRDLGSTPLLGVRLRAGVHELVLTDPRSGRTEHVRVQIRALQTTAERVRFR